MSNNLAERLIQNAPESSDTPRDQHTGRILQLVLIRDSEQTTAKQKQLAANLITRLRQFLRGGQANQFAIVATDALVREVVAL